jgi:hypothetical protein
LPLSDGAERVAAVTAAFLDVGDGETADLARTVAKEAGGFAGAEHHDFRQHFADVAAHCRVGQDAVGDGVEDFLFGDFHGFGRLEVRQL